MSLLVEFLGTGVKYHFIGPANIGCRYLSPTKQNSLIPSGRIEKVSAKKKHIQIPHPEKLPLPSKKG